MWLLWQLVHHFYNCWSFNHSYWWSTIIVGVMVIVVCAYNVTTKFIIYTSSFPLDCSTTSHIHNCSNNSSMCVWYLLICFICHFCISSTNYFRRFQIIPLTFTQSTCHTSLPWLHFGLQLLPIGVTPLPPLMLATFIISQVFHWMMFF